MLGDATFGSIFDDYANTINQYPSIGTIDGGTDRRRRPAIFFRVIGYFLMIDYCHDWLFSCYIDVAICFVYAE